MRILWVNENASLIGGCEQYILQTSRLLHLRGYHSTLLYQSSKNSEKEFLESFDDAYLINDLKDQLEKIPHDLIFVHQLTSEEVIETLLESTAPVIRFFHDYHLFCLRRNKIIPFTNSPCDRVAGCLCYPLWFSLRPKDRFPWIRIRTMGEMRRAQKINQKLDGYLVASEYVAGQVLANGFDPEKLRTIPLYAPDVPFRPVVRESRQLLFVGQLIRGKGVDIAIRAMNHLSEQYTLKIVGEGKQRKKYQELTKKLNLDQRIEFLGKVPYEELVKWYQRSTCLIVPTRYPELFGLVGVEAMSFGTPIVASQVGAIPEWLEDGRSGFIIPPNDPKKLADKVETICESEDLALQMGAEGRRIYEEKFLPENHLRELIHFFEESIQVKRKKLSYGKFTVFGSEEIEQKITSLIDEVKLKIQHEVPSHLYRTIALIGSYGKGEGGVENGHAHNNLDFLIVSKTFFPSLREKVRALITPISKKYEIGFDISEISESKLSLSSPHLLWYEMVHEHKFLLGDRKYLPSLPFGDVDSVLEQDLIELMVNRGTLLIINRFLLDTYQPLTRISHIISSKDGRDGESDSLSIVREYCPTDKARAIGSEDGMTDHSDLPRVCEKSGLNRTLSKVFIKHMMKAIIGFGDAYLFFHGHYHWSYRERLARISLHPAIPSELKEKYQEAAEFRFQPDYEKYLDRDFAGWLSSIEKLLSSIYLECEKIHLKDSDLQIINYCDRVLESSFWEEWTRLSGLFRKGRGLIHPPHNPLGTSLLAKTSFWLLSPSARLRMMFPIVAFWGNDEKLRQKVALFLNSPSNSIEDLRKAYLQQWKIHGDVNFFRSVEEWNLDL